jgi:hypothetical protein
MEMRRHVLLVTIVITFGAIAVAQVSDNQQSQNALKSGEKVSTALATVTGTAMSPLLGVSAIGAWQYYQTPKPQRDRLPLMQKPKFWVPILLLLALIFVKDTFGVFAPPIKKPLDAVEVLFVNHAALVLLAFPFVLNQVSRMMGFTSLREMIAGIVGGPVVYAAASANFGTYPALSAATAAFYTVVGLIVTCIVWLVGQAFDVMILISPFPLLDALLKMVRIAVFSLLAATALMSPKLGLVLSVVIIVISLRLFGWALRMSFFGTAFAWSLLRMLTLEEHVTLERGARVPAFSAWIGNLPQRTYGLLSLGVDGNLLFCYRRLLFGPQRTISVGSSETFAVGQAVLFPTIIMPNSIVERNQVRFRLLPEFRGAEESVRSCLGMSEVCDLRWTKGFREFWKFMTNEAGSAV